MKTADYIFWNGIIYPQSGVKTADAMAVSGETILYVGSDRKIWESFAGPETKMIDLEGRIVLPGFIDAHTHPTCIALTEWRVILSRTQNLDELLEQAAAYCRKHPKEEVPFFVGESYFLTMFDENGPTKELLDRYIPDRPARMQDFTDHSCWYNSLALEYLGITKDRPDPEMLEDSPGEIIRRADSDPTGWVLEVPDSRLEEPLYERIGWYPPMQATEETLMPFLKFLSRCGVTALMDGFTGSEADIRLFWELDQKGVLPMYYEGAVLLTSAEEDAIRKAVETAVQWQQDYSSKHVHIHTVKVFLDGTNELGDSASLEPLRTESAGKNYGTLHFTEEELLKIMLRLNEAGLDLHLHMVCDRAFRTACNALERARMICGEDFRISVTAAHCELIHPDDRKRPAELGMILNWTPHWSGGYFGEKARDYLGEERFCQMYDFREILQSGAVVAMSSDVFSYKEVNRANPFFGIQCGATRVDPELPMDPCRYPGSVRPPIEAKLSVEQLIHGYTWGGAVQLRLDDRMGTLEPGKLANFMILTADPYRIPKEEISAVEPESVWFEGRIVAGGLYVAAGHACAGERDESGKRFFH